jgi:hypothetical protein
MTILDFAEKYRLKLVRDSCGDPMIQGRMGKDSNLSDYNDDELAMCYDEDLRASFAFCS